MKKMLCMIMALVMALSLAVPAFAVVSNGAGGDTTAVTYEASAAGTSETWTLEVPATLVPGATGDVTLSGEWASTRQATVTADTKVTMECDISNDTIDLTVTLPEFVVAGNNKTEITPVTKQVSVANWTSAPLFGEWTGTFSYAVAIADVPAQNS